MGFLDDAGEWISDASDVDVLPSWEDVGNAVAATVSAIVEAVLPVVEAILPALFDSMVSVWGAVWDSMIGYESSVIAALTVFLLVLGTVLYLGSMLLRGPAKQIVQMSPAALVAG